MILPRFASRLCTTAFLLPLTVGLLLWSHCSSDNELNNAAQLRVRPPSSRRTPPPLFVSNGTGGGSWFDPQTWSPPGVPGTLSDYDAVHILSGDTVTQNSPLPRTLGYYLLDRGAVHFFQDIQELRCLYIEAFGMWRIKLTQASAGSIDDGSDASSLNGKGLVVRNTARFYPQNNQLAFRRTFDPDYCQLIDKAPPPFDILRPCTLATSTSYPNDGSPQRYDDNTTHRALTTVAVDNNQCRLNQFLQKHLRLAAGIDALASLNGIERTLQNWVIEGSQLEDEDGRFCNHFLDPTTNTGLTASWFELLGVCRTQNEPADLWGFNGVGNEWSFSNARAYYLNSLSKAVRLERDADLARTFRAVGQVVHLIEDMAQPEHTRNDPHPPVGEQGAYERWTRANFGSVSQIAGGELPGITGMSGTTHPLFNLNTALVPLPIHNKYGDFFDTGQWTGGAISFAGFSRPPGLAEFSNINFLSLDTIVDSSFPYPDLCTQTNLPSVCPPACPSGRQPRIRSEDAPFDGLPGLNFLQFASGIPGLVSVPRLAVAHPNCIPGGDSVTTQYDPPGDRATVSLNHPDVWRSYAEILLPKAIAYSTDFINYFFRGRLDVHVVHSPGVYQLNIVNSSSEALGAGEWLLYQDDSSGNRGLVSADFTGYSGSLQPTEHFVARFFPTSATRYTLVFHGTIGHEVGTGVAVGTFEIIQADVLWDPSSLQDLYMRAPNGVIVGPDNLVTEFAFAQPRFLPSPGVCFLGRSIVTLFNPSMPGRYEFMVNFYKDWCNEYICLPFVGCFCAGTCFNCNLDLPGSPTYCPTLVFDTFRVFHKGSLAHQVGFTTFAPNEGANFPPPGLPVGPFGDSWYVAQIVTVDENGLITVEGASPVSDVASPLE